MLLHEYLDMLEQRLVNKVDHQFDMQLNSQMYNERYMLTLKAEGLPLGTTIVYPPVPEQAPQRQPAGDDDMEDDPFNDY